MFTYRKIPIDDLYSKLELEHLETRRTVADLVVVHKLVNGEMVYPDVLQLLNFKTPSSTRSNYLFIRQHYGTNYAANSTVARLQRAGNNLPVTVDLFHNGVRTLKWKVKVHCTVGVEVLVQLVLKLYLALPWNVETGRR
ncbi:hypothetical protein J6590_006048 [Homalodisca vitripennis]|nr:hypothetical protein J6590_006048 [Homalodisca vitripennis]